MECFLNAYTMVRRTIVNYRHTFQVSHGQYTSTQSAPRARSGTSGLYWAILWWAVHATSALNSPSFCSVLLSDERYCWKPLRSSQRWRYEIRTSWHHSNDRKVDLRNHCIMCTAGGKGSGGLVVRMEEEGRGWWHDVSCQQFTSQ